MRAKDGTKMNLWHELGSRQLWPFSKVPGLIDTYNIKLYNKGGQCLGYSFGNVGNLKLCGRDDGSDSQRCKLALQ